MKGLSYIANRQSEYVSGREDHAETKDGKCTNGDREHTEKEWGYMSVLGSVNGKEERESGVGS